MTTKLILLAIISILLIASTSFAPLPYYLAINYETKQCGEYWGGDEFVNFDLPPGWNTYEYQYSDGYTIVETTFGTCKVPAMQTSLAEACCTQLGYTYIPDNVGILRLTPENIANQKAVNDYVARSNAQAKAERIQTLLLYSIAFLVVVLCIAVVAQWLYEKRNSK